MSDVKGRNTGVQSCRSLGSRNSRTIQSLRRLAGAAWAARLSLVVAVVLLLVLPLAVGRFWTRVLVQAGFAVMMGLGLNVMVGYTGLQNYGYAGYFAIGAYTYAILASPQFDLHLPFCLLFPLAGVLAAVVGALLAIPVLPLRGDYLALVTVGFGEVIRLLANNLSVLTGGPQGLIQIDRPSILFYHMARPRDYYYVVLFLCAVEVLVMRRLQESRIGRAWMAIREDEDAARAMGLDTKRLKLLACAIGAAPAGLVGVLFAGIQTYVSPISFTLVESIAVMSAIIIGGAGSIPGVILGALLLNIAPEPLRKYTQDYRMLIYGVLIIIFLQFRPQGIWPASHRPLRGWEELGNRVEDNKSV